MANYNSNIEISVIIPVYKAEENLDELIERLKTQLGLITNSYEIILVDDGSPDDSWYKILTNSKHNPGHIKGVKLSRNFGQHYAITAGIDYCVGKWTIVMDCDLQDRPEEIPNLYKKALEGYDIVLASRTLRRDKFLKSTFSKIFYTILSYLTGTYHDPHVANFGVYSYKVINGVKDMRESIRYFPTMVRWVGFKSTTIPVVHAERLKGKTTYDFKKLLSLAIDIILAYSDKPIRLSIKFGFLISLISFLFAVVIFYFALTGKVLVSGYASLIISLSFFSGLIISILGIIGLYVGKTFEVTKKRPLYFVDEKTF